MGPKKRYPAAASTSKSSEDAPSSSKKTKPNTEKETFTDFLQRIADQRKTTASSVSEFKFEKSRCRIISGTEELKAGHSGILYWMSRDQRVQDNWALLYAQRLALKEKVPLFVCFCLVPKFLEATLRQYAFMLKGLKEVRQELHKLKIPFYLLKGQPATEIPTFVKKQSIGGVVTDFAPLRVPSAWVEEVGKTLATEGVPLAQVDTHNVIPVWVTSDKQEYAARTIRSKIDKNMIKYLTEFPPVIEHIHKGEFDKTDPFENWDDLISTLEIDKSIKEVESFKPGAEEGLKMLKSFVDSRLKDYHSKRNDPNEAALSNLSPWFHFGQISVARAVLEVKKSSHKESVGGFVEEAVVRRELSDNFCFYNSANYDSLSGAFDWAKKTLEDHKKDKRSHLYSKEQFETAKTHDPLWNAAQNQMRIEGKMHGFLRMYWAKKILEWTSSPEEALQISIYLNDKYNLDGRDPNGYVGCMWSICGIHDQGWAERPVFGKIRYMNYQGCKRKFDVAAFENKYKKMASDHGLA